jgi:Fe-S oxidoreductase
MGYAVEQEVLKCLKTQRQVTKRLISNERRIRDKTDIIAAGCPFCNTMLTDGIKIKKKEGDVKVMDIAELIANAQDL